jgi:FtsP/CotA-like multicopper oxidase with cupredoxin domain
MHFRILAPLICAALAWAAPTSAQVNIQCPCDRNGDGDCLDIKSSGAAATRYNEPNLAASLGVQCMHLTGGDGFAVMADGRPQYMFGFSDVTGTPQADVPTAGLLAAQWPAPTIAVDQGKKFYLTLTNVGMVIRPDLFDPHSVHFHGFPQSSTVFDGLPESGIAINQGASLTYFYDLVEPGTYMYHCHVEATEHMQMGMLGILYVRPKQNGTALGTCANGPCTTFAYNDGDGSTGYDVEYALQLGSWDPDFHDASWSVQPLPFALMWDRYPMINGRGYPDTVNAASVCTDDPTVACESASDCGPGAHCALPPPAENGGIPSQRVSSLVTAKAGQKVLLRLSNLNITAVHTLSSPSIPMRVVGIDAKQLRAADPDGDGPLTYENLDYVTNSVTLGGGMSADVILDTAGVPAGEYYLYASNLHYLANNAQATDLGGMMTKIVIN